MSFWEKLFGKKPDPAGEGKGKKPDPVPATAPRPAAPVAPTPAADPAAILAAQQMDYAQKVQEKKQEDGVSDEELFKLFAEYFAPNKSFYAAPGSPVSAAYFGAVKAAQQELLATPELFEEATGRDIADLREQIEHPKPGISSCLICGMIFCAGRCAVVQDMLYCVDFCNYIPNCIALYLLLLAQKQPADKRSQGLDLGDGADKAKMQAALDRLKICDPSWKPQILWP